MKISLKVMLDINNLVLTFVFKSKKMNELIYKLSTEHEFKAFYNLVRVT